MPTTIFGFVFALNSGSGSGWHLHVSLLSPPRLLTSNQRGLATWG